MNNLLMKMAFNYAMDRLKEPSTWAAIAAGLAGTWNIQFNSDFNSAFVAFGLAAATILGIILKEGIKK